MSVRSDLFDSFGRRRDDPRRQQPNPTFPTPTLRYSAKPRGVPMGSETKKRSRSTPDRLFVCDECYTKARKGLPTPATHRACRWRLQARSLA